MIRRLGMVFRADVTVDEMRRVLASAPADSVMIVCDEGELSWEPARQVWMPEERKESREWSAADTADWEWRKNLKELLDLVHSVMMDDAEGGDDPEDA